MRAAPIVLSLSFLVSCMAKDAPLAESVDLAPASTIAEVGEVDEAMPVGDRFSTGEALDVVAAPGPGAIRGGGGVAGLLLGGDAGPADAMPKDRGGSVAVDAPSAESEKTADRVYMAKKTRSASAEMRRDPAPPPIAPVDRTPLKAGSTDDNADFGAFQEFLGRWTDRSGLDGRYQRVDVRDRAFVSVVDQAGLPLPGAEVTVGLGGTVLQRATTYGDGRAMILPQVSLGDAGPLPLSAELDVTVSWGGTSTAAPWFGTDELQVVVRSDGPATGVVPIDVAIVLDTTGSMADEIDRIKGTLLSTTEKIRSLGQEVDLRFGAVLYRDHGDAYVTRTTPFTGDVRAFDAELRGVQAGGGGDTPEALNEGLATAVDDLDWRSGAARVAFVIADAPPHMDYPQDVPYGTTAVSALEQGIRVHTVAASGLDEVGSLVFRQIAQATRGRFIFIEYGSVAASAERHGVADVQLQSNNLDAILFERIKAEVEGWRKPSLLSRR